MINPRSTAELMVDDSVVVYSSAAGSIGRSGVCSWNALTMPASLYEVTVSVTPNTTAAGAVMLVYTRPGSADPHPDPGSSISSRECTFIVNLRSRLPADTGPTGGNRLPVCHWRACATPSRPAEQASLPAEVETPRRTRLATTGLHCRR